MTITKWSLIPQAGLLGPTVIPSRTASGGMTMANPYTNPYPGPPVPQPSRPAPRWARKRYVLPALALGLFLGVGIGGGGGETTTDAKPAAARPQATVTVTATPLAKEPEPAPTVTATKTVRVTTTVTAPPEAGGVSDDSDSGGSDVYYANCSAVRAAGAAPIHRGEPGYASHLDRDNDGVACDT
ncbi:hypothetical protein GCM10010383_06340 [Streptomyces lomondensis]|uniref:Excalibur calcium-binding domain-containing protein n=2 Tax=Streptomyces lomondensis TaxID=68229 RepID=A0ABQ2WYV8_9ACTN|nr:hypothetical protein GCM10010383_06340 [Streptomyces lomondensis]